MLLKSRSNVIEVKFIEYLQQHWETPQHDFLEKKQLNTDKVQKTLLLEDDIDDVTREVHENDFDD